MPSFSLKWHYTSTSNVDIKPRVHKSPHKFMLTSYMKYFAKFLALLLHNTSFFILHNLISLLHIPPKFHCHSLISPIFHYFWVHFGQIFCNSNASIIYGLAKELVSSLYAFPLL